MNEGIRGCLKSTAIGCGIAVLVAVAVPVILAVMIMVPLNHAVDDREALEAAFGAQEDYVPPASGVPFPERIEAFIAVQRSLDGVCADMEAAEASVERLEDLDDSDDVSRIEVVGMAWSTTKNMMGIGPVIGQLYENRNRKLIELEMSLGEFTYLFVMAFHGELLDPSYEPELFGPGPVNARIRGTLRSMLQNQLAELEKTDAAEEEISALRAELGRLDADRSRIPWQDGLPKPISAAFDPYRQDLAALFCPAAAPLELMINQKRAFGIESN